MAPRSPESHPIPVLALGHCQLPSPAGPGRGTTAVRLNLSGRWDRDVSLISVDGVFSRGDSELVVRGGVSQKIF